MLCTELWRSHGGIQRYNRLLVDALEASSDNACVSVISQLDHPSSPSPGRRASMAGCDGARARFLGRALAEVRARPDFVWINHLHLAPLTFACRVLAPRAQVIVTAFGEEVWRSIPPLRLAGLRRCDRILSISRYTADQLKSLHSVDEARIAVVPLSLDRHFGMTPGDRHDEPFFLVVSRLETEHRYKGVNLVLQALAQLKASQRLHGWRCVVVGDGSDRPNLQAQAAEAGLDDVVEFRGHVSETQLTDLYARCGAFVLPSAGEGFGLVYLEAMAWQKPVIASASGAVPEVVDDGVTGLLVPHGDIAALAATLERIAADVGLRRALGSAGRQRSATTFAFERFSAAVGNLIASAGFEAPRIRESAP